MTRARRCRPTSPRRRPPLTLEWLEARIVPSASSLADDAGSTLATSRALTLSSIGSAAVTGTFSNSDDTDAFRLVADRTGSLAVHLLGAAGDQLDTDLQVFDTSGDLLAANDDSLGGLDSQTTFHAVAGQTYLLLASISPFNDTPFSDAKNYALFVTPYTDDQSGDPTPITLSATAAAQQAGRIEVVNDTDRFSFVAPASGGLIIGQSAAPGSRLDSYLTLRDASGTVLAQNDDAPGGVDSRIVTHVVAGQTYVVEAAASPYAHAAGSVGDYLLRFQYFADEAGDTVGDSLALPLGTSQETIGAAGDVDVLHFTAPAAPANLAVSITTPAGSALDPTITVTAADGSVLLATAEAVPVSSSPGSARSFRAVVQTDPGQAVYVRVAGVGDSQGAYTLGVNSYTDDAGDTIGRAAPFPVSAAGDAVRSGRVEVVGDRDVFRIISPLTGMLRADLSPTASSSLHGSLTVLDDSGNAVATAAAGTPLAFAVTAGTTYYLQVEGDDQTTGGYQLRLANFSDDVSNDRSRPLSLPTFTGAAQTVARSFEAAGDVDWYGVTVASAGMVEVRLSPATGTASVGGVDVYDAATGDLLASSISSYGVETSAAFFQAAAGQSFLVVARQGGDAIGGYRLTISPAADDFGDTPATAGRITLSAAGVGEQLGAIDYPDDTDLFTFVSTITGSLVVRQQATAGSPLDSTLTAYDDSGTQLATDDDYGGSLDSEVTLQVVRGATYQLRAGAYSTSMGAYRLSLAPLVDDYPDTRADAAPLRVGADGSASVLGSIETAGDVDVFSFTASSTEGLVVRQQATAGSYLDSLLTIYDATGDLTVPGSGNVVATDDDSGDTLDSLASFQAQAGHTYYIQAGAYSTSTGDYRLTLASVRDDFGNTFATADPVVASPTADTTQAGEIEVPGDVDRFNFVASYTGGLSIRLDPTAGSSLAGLVTAYDPAGDQLAQSGYSTSRINLYVTAGRTYSIEAASLYGASGSYNSYGESGGYTLTFHPYQDDVPDTAAQAQPLTLVDGAATQAGRIDAVGDVDVYSFTATTSGQLDITMAAADGSTLDSFLQVDGTDYFNVTSRSDDNFGGTLDSAVQLDAVAGQTYYIRLSASPTATDALSTGGYRLRIAPTTDDYPNNTAFPIALDAAGDGQISGDIESRSDFDVFYIVAPTTGTITVRQTAVPGSQLDSLLEIYTNGQFLAINDDSGGTQNSEVTFAANQGQTYYIYALGSDYFSTSGENNPADTGGYVVTVSPGPALGPDDFGNTPATASALPAVAPGYQQAGRIEQPWDLDDFYTTVPADGDYVVTLAGDGADPLPNGVVRVTQDGADVGSQVYDSARSLYHLLAGVRYDFQVNSEYLSATGGYLLSVDPYQDDVGDTIDTATPLPSSATAGVDGVIGTPGDVDVFAYTAPMSGNLTVREQAAPTSPLDSLLTVLDANGATLATNDDSGDPDALNALDSRLTLPVVAGQTYYISAAAYSTSVGTYHLSLSLVTDIPDTFDGASVLPVANDGDASATSQIDQPGDRDMFAYDATRTTTVEIHENQTDGSLDSYLRVYDADGSLLASNDDSGGTTDSLVTLAVQAGRRYYFEAGSYGDYGTGGYQLLVQNTDTDDFGDTPAEAFPIDLSTGAAVQKGTINTPDDRDVFRLVAPYSGQLQVGRTDSSYSLYGSIDLLDASGQVIASGYSYAGASLTGDLVAGQTYYLRISGDGTTTGDYSLNFQMSRLLDDAATASAQGAIAAGSTGDRYTFTADTTGSAQVNLHAADGSALDPQLTIYDAYGYVIARNSDYGGSLDSQVTFNVVAGASYTILAAGTPVTGPAGAYRLDLRQSASIQQDANSTSVLDQTFSPSPQGSQSAYGALGLPGVQNVFSFQATTTGWNVLTTSNTSLDLALSVYDDDDQLIASTSQPDQVAGQLAFQTQAGRTYYVRVGADAQSGSAATGSYSLALAPSDSGNTRSTATAVSLGGDGTAALGGSLNAGVADFFRFQPDGSDVRIDLSSPTGRLQSSLSIYDAEGNLITQGTGAIRFTGTAGAVYYAQLAGAASEKYELNIDSPEDANPADPGGAGKIGPHPPGFVVAGGSSGSGSIGGSGLISSQLLTDGDLEQLFSTSLQGTRDVTLAQGLTLFSDGAHGPLGGLASRAAVALAALEDSALSLVATLIVGVDLGSPDGEPEGKTPPAVGLPDFDEALRLRVDAAGLGKGGPNPEAAPARLLGAAATMPPLVGGEIERAVRSLLGQTPSAPKAATPPTRVQDLLLPDPLPARDPAPPDVDDQSLAQIVVISGLALNAVPRGPKRRSPFDGR